MPRPLRDLDTSEWFHVYNRGSDGQDIFTLEGDHELFESLVGEAARRTGVEVHVFALMSNHFHLLVRAAGADLSEFVRLLCARYAAAYNQRAHRSGPVFTGRFGSVPVADDAHLLVEARYVERNPLAFVPPEALANYRYSSLGCYLGSRPAPEWLTLGFMADLMSVAEYGQFVLDRHPTDRMPLGRLPALDPIEPLQVIAAVAASTGVDPVAQSGSARNLATAITLELRVASSADLADVLDISAAGIRQSARRGRIAIDTDPDTKAAHDRIVDRLRRAA